MSYRSNRRNRKPFLYRRSGYGAWDQGLRHGSGMGLGRLLFVAGLGALAVVALAVRLGLL